MCSNPCESEVTCFRPESNRGHYGLLNFWSAALSTTELWWRMNRRKSFRTLLTDGSFTSRFYFFLYSFRAQDQIPASPSGQSRPDVHAVAPSAESLVARGRVCVYHWPCVCVRCGAPNYNIQSKDATTADSLSPRLFRGCCWCLFCTCNSHSSSLSWDRDVSDSCCISEVQILPLPIQSEVRKVHHLTKKWILSMGVLDVTKRILSSKTRFAENQKSWPKHCENWRRESGSEFHKARPMCERGEWRKQLRDFITQSLKQTPLGSFTSQASCRSL